MHSVIVKTINHDLGKFENQISDTINNLVAQLNQVNSTAYMDNVLNNTNYLLNMSTTAAPDLNHLTGLLTLHFDGLFYDVAQ